MPPPSNSRCWAVDVAADDGSSIKVTAAAGPISARRCWAGMHEGLDIGRDRRAPVDWTLRERHGVVRHSGTVDEVVIESGPFIPDSAFGKG
jgi:hypothetical protein